MSTQQERLLNHADAEQISKAFEDWAEVSPIPNDGDIGELPSHDDGLRLIAAINRLKDYITNLFFTKVDKVNGKSLSTNDFTNGYKDKLDGIAPGAEVNVQPDWSQDTTTEDDYIKNKPTLGTAAARDATNGITEDSTDLIESGAVYSGLAEKIDLTEKGSASGVAELDENGKVPAAQLPGFVDDVIECESVADFPATGESGKLYVALDTNKTYRWGGSAYAEVSESLALGETASTAYAGNKGKANADAITAIKDGTSIDSFSDVESALNTKVDKISGKGLSTEDYTSAEKSKLSSIESGAQVNTVTSVAGKTGDVSLQKSDVGLGNVGNFKAVSTESNQGLTDAEKAAARANIGAGSSTFSGDYNDLSNKPTLGTSSALNVPSSGNAGNNEVVKGDDIRLSDARPSSDVPLWAKQESKPTYQYSEIENRPSLGTASGKNYTTSIASGNNDVPTSNAVYTALQNAGGDDFASKTTTFNGNIITEQYANKQVVTTFNSNGTITEQLKDAAGTTVQKTKITTFNADGSISEVVS